MRCRQSLKEGNSANIEGEVERCIRSVAMGSGYILCSSGSMLESSPANSIAMVSHAKRMGKYNVIIGNAPQNVVTNVGRQLVVEIPMDGKCSIFGNVDIFTTRPSHIVS